MANEVVDEVNAFVAEIKESNNALVQASGFLIVVPFLALSILAGAIPRWELAVVSVPMIVATVFFALAIGLVVRFGQESFQFSGAIAMSTMLSTYSTEQLKAIDSILGEGYVERLGRTLKGYKPSQHTFPTGGWAFTLFALGIVMLVITLIVVVLALVL